MCVRVFGIINENSYQAMDIVASEEMLCMGKKIKVTPLASLYRKLFTLQKLPERREAAYLNIQLTNISLFHSYFYIQ